ARGAAIIAFVETTWSLEPAPIVLCGVAAVLYAQAFARLRRRAPAHATVSRAALFGAGLAATLLALVSPVDAVGEDQLLSAHMLQHLLLGDLGPLLLVLGTRGPIGVFLLPAPVLQAVARGPLRRLLSTLLRPRVSLAIWLASIGAWHVPAAYDAALAPPALPPAARACSARGGRLGGTQFAPPSRRGRLGGGGGALS